MDSPLNELLASFYIVCSAGQGGVHQVDGEVGDVHGAEHASDRECRAEMPASRGSPWPLSTRAPGRFESAAAAPYHHDSLSDNPWFGL